MLFKLHQSYFSDGEGELARVRGRKSNNELHGNYTNQLIDNGDHNDNSESLVTVRDSLAWRAHQYVELVTELRVANIRTYRSTWVEVLLLSEFF